MPSRPPLRSWLLLLVALLVVAGCAGGDGATTHPGGVGVPSIHPEVDRLPAAALEIRDPDGTPIAEVAVRIAHTPAQRRQGLMGVAELPPDSGMLFVYATDGRRSFWMKDTLVPLDIAWLASDGQVVAVATMEPCPAEPCPSHAPDVDHRHALEVPAGTFADLGLEVGWRVELPEGLPSGR